MRLPATPSASSTFLAISGTSPYQLSWVPPTGRQYSTISDGGSSNAAGFASTTLMTIPAGVLTASSTIQANFYGSCYDKGGNGGTCMVYLHDSTGATLAALDLTQIGTNNMTFTGSLDVVGTSLTTQSSWAFAQAFVTHRAVPPVRPVPLPAARLNS
jgi:hypothetical protein